MYSIGICDDEKGTCAELENMIYQYGKEGGIEVEVNVWYSGESLCNYLRKEDSLDILFLDVDLISTDGIIVGHFIREELEQLDTLIVFISSKSSYAMQLFRIQPIDFLIKPIEIAQIKEVMDLCISTCERKNLVFEYRVKGTYYKVPYKEILYFYSQDKKINIVMKDKEVQFNGKLKAIAKSVPRNFILIHQSYLVNLDYVDECSYETATLQDGTILNISQPYRKRVKEQIMRYKWRK